MLDAKELVTAVVLARVIIVVLVKPVTAHKLPLTSTMMMIAK